MLYMGSDLVETLLSFFEERGSHGCEGTALLGGVNSGEHQHAHRVVIPDQIANPYPDCWVAVTTKGKLEIASVLQPEERYFARVHSHPGEAFHSPTDADNLVLTAEGALSIVVPYFGLALRNGVTACTSYRMSGGTWKRVDPAGVIHIVGD